MTPAEQQLKDANFARSQAEKAAAPIRPKATCKTCKGKGVSARLGYPCNNCRGKGYTGGPKAGNGFRDSQRYFFTKK